MQQPIGVDYCETPLYVGVDVGKRSWQVTILSKDRELGSFQSPAEVSALVHHLRDRYRGAAYHVAYEAGFCGFWIQRGLQAQGVPCIVVHPADVPTTNKERSTKTDRVDARKIAMGLRAGQLRGIYVPTESQEQARVLVRSRGRVCATRRRVRQQVTSLLDQLGVVPPKGMAMTWSKRMMTWLGDLQLGTAHGTEALRMRMSELKFYDAHVDHVEAQILECTQSDPWRRPVELLMSIVGIGRTSAALWAVELYPITRFASVDQLASFVGVVPAYRQSGATETVMGVTHRGTDLRQLLAENSWVAIQHDPELRAMYHRLVGPGQRRMNANKAIVHIGKHLLARMRAVWLRDQPYVVRTPKAARLIVKKLTATQKA